MLLSRLIPTMLFFHVVRKSPFYVLYESKLTKA